MNQEPSKATIVSEDKDKKWKTQWDFYPTHATLTVQKKDRPYWFLYEGTPGSSFEKDDDYWLISDGTRKKCSIAKPGDISSPEWICFGDSRLKRVLFLYHHEDDKEEDKFYQMQEKMTVFGFGRSGTTKYLNSVPQHFTIGFAEDSTYMLVRVLIPSLVVTSRRDVLDAIGRKKRGSLGVGNVQGIIDDYLNAQ